jgi:tetratricopeptide (TPR) repeat protein
VYLVTAADFTPADHRRLAVLCNNSTWEMVESARTPANDEEMLRRAYAAAFHWQHAEGRGPANEARALWLLAKVHLVAGLAERALHYADACVAECARHGLADFDLAYALEARARALQVLGRTDEAASEWAAAQAVPIADPDDRAAVEADLAEGP